MTSAAVAAATRRVYERVLADWRPVVTVAVRTVAASEPRLVARARTVAGDDAWFRACEAEFSAHPCFPRPTSPPGGDKRPRDASQ